MSNFIEANSKGFTSISNKIFYDTNINTTAKAVYCIICSACYGDKDSMFANQTTIAEAIGKSVRTVQRAIKLLVEHSYISVRRRGSISNVMTIIGKNMHTKVKQVIESVKRVKKDYKSKKSTGHFNDYEQRSYDFDTLERQLLGWDNLIQEDIAGEKFQQQIIT